MASKMARPAADDVEEGAAAAAAPVEDTEETVQWRCEHVLAMVLEHAGKPLNKPGAHLYWLAAARACLKVGLVRCLVRRQV
jgi:hypothetical protein